MKTYDVECPVCGHMNRNLYLEETEGWMECECCGHVTRQAIAAKTVKLHACGREDVSKVLASVAS